MFEIFKNNEKNEEKNISFYINSKEKSLEELISLEKEWSYRYSRAMSRAKNNFEYTAPERIDYEKNVISQMNALLSDISKLKMQISILKAIEQNIPVTQKNMDYLLEEKELQQCKEISTYSQIVEDKAVIPPCIERAKTSLEEVLNEQSKLIKERREACEMNDFGLANILQSKVLELIDLEAVFTKSIPILEKVKDSKSITQKEYNLLITGIPLLRDNQHLLAFVNEEVNVNTEENKLKL